MDMNAVLTWLRSRSPAGKTATGLYGSIVTQARVPAFYLAGGVPDTMEGRFGVVGLHMFAVLERIRQEGAVGQALARALLEAFMTDMDDNMREIGVGDTVVPRRVKKAAAALQEHLAAYRAARTAGDAAALSAALTRYVLLDGSSGTAIALATYLDRTEQHLATQSWAVIAAGRITFPTFV
jgi:cytochrome b pre-mRNA-processing protein 3